MRRQSSVLTGLLLLALVGPSQQITFQSDDCQIHGDPDLYGLGLRLNYYISYASIVIAILPGLPETLHMSMKTFNLVLLAITIKLLVNLAHGSFTYFEWAILTPIFSLVMIPHLMLGYYSPRSWLVSGITGVLCGIQLLVIPAPYWVLLEQGRNSHCMELGAGAPRYFLFAYFNLYDVNWIRFIKALSVLACVCGGTVLTWSLSLLFSLFTQEKLDLEIKFEKHAEEMERWKNAHLLRKILVGVYIVLGVYFIIFTENMLAGNNVDLSSASFMNTGQILPVILGLYGLSNTLYVWRRATATSDFQKLLPLWD